MTPTRKSTNSSDGGRHVTIGYALTAAREDMKLSLTEAAQATKIKPEQLARFESGRFSLEDSYHRGLLESYARFLELDTETMLDADRPKPKGRRRQKPNKSVLRRNFKRKRAVVASTSAKTGLAIGFVSLAVGSIALLIYIFFSAPRLEVHGLADVTYTADTSVVVEGATSSGSDVYINSTPVLVNPQGEFEQRIFLESGVNIITIEATNSLSRTAREEKVVIAEYEPFN